MAGLFKLASERISSQLPPLNRTLAACFHMPRFSPQPTAHLPRCLALAILCGLAHAVFADEFHDRIKPMLEANCYGCHANGSAEGNLAFDKLETSELLANKQIWWNVLKNVRSGLMPPASEPRVSDDDKKALYNWIQTEAFDLDPSNPDPGRVTVRRLNRQEYHNTIRDLMGIDYNADVVFPPDDTGFGFDNNGDVLSLSPMLLEKYLTSARDIVREAVPTLTKITPINSIYADAFKNEGGNISGRRLDAKVKTTVNGKLNVADAGTYNVNVQVRLHGSFFHNPARCKVHFYCDDELLYEDEYGWDENKKQNYTFNRELTAGDHQFRFDIDPVSGTDDPNKSQGEFPGDDTFVFWNIDSVELEGPLNVGKWVHPKNYERFFDRDEPPTDEADRRAYTAHVLTNFASKAFRRPVDEATVERLVQIAEAARAVPNSTFESSVGQAMTAVLASPRFIFRLEQPLADSSDVHPMIDEYSLASRLSYFMWSTMPDAQLLELAGKNQLRQNLPEQIDRMMKDKRSDSFVSNFVGQWLRSRDVEHVSIDPIVVLGKKKEYDDLRSKFRRRPRNGEPPIPDEEAKEIRRKFRELRDLGDKFNGDTRAAMQSETQMLFDHIVRNDLSVLDMIDCNYTFVNEKLASLYGIEGVKGKEMRRVDLPEGSPRGGILTQGTMLVVTSNPTRTSPVKRGLFVLENILGLPAPPAPPEVPELEASVEKFAGREPSQRELLAAHRDSPLCASCHARMDPLGFALENFNAIGMWRDKELDQPVDATGTLATGESFQTIQELKQILREGHRDDYYRCLTQKLLIYALGRGLDYHDEPTIDAIVTNLEANGGKFSSLLGGVIDSTAFQRHRRSPSEQSTADNRN